MTSFEVNFDGLVGPTHNYSGLSYGNVASVSSQKQTSNPKQAALQGLSKMKYLMDLGLKQAVLPPQERPHLPTLRSIGFNESEENILATAFRQSPELFYACSSASCMWSANAATISPSTDNLDGLVHITPANLSNKLHRSIEADTTAAVLKKTFSDPRYFVHHSPLPSSNILSDEGAANHTRFCQTFSRKGVQLFVYGRQGFGEVSPQPSLYPARQTLEASQAISRLHQIPPSQLVFAQQNPLAIDAGVFHNDVISVGHQNLFLYHEQAFVNTGSVIEEIAQKMGDSCNAEMIFIEVPSDKVSLKEAVNSYLFNSQIICCTDNSMELLAPKECLETATVKAFIEKIIKDPQNPINSVRYFNLHESMRNGGGPACLRLRVVLNEEELQAAHAPVFLTEQLYADLVTWVNKYYRDRLEPKDLADPQLWHDNLNALDELTKLLQLGSLYSFQQ